MPLFIALSGCLWAIKDKRTLSLKRIVSDKSRRLLKPFLFTALFLSIPLKWISGYWGDLQETLLNIIFGQLLFVGNANSHLWFLQTLFLVFIFAYYIEKFKLRRNSKVFLFSLLFISILGHYIINQRINFLNIPYAMMYLFWFYIGCYFEKCREQINSFMSLKLNKWKILMLFVGIQMILSFLNLKIPHLLTYFTYYALATSGMLLAYAVCYKVMLMRCGLIDKTLKTISKNSYDLYLFSDPFNYIFIFILGLIPNYEIMFTDNLISLGIYLLRFIFTAFSAWLIIKLIKHLKALPMLISRKA